MIVVQRVSIDDSHLRRVFLSLARRRGLETYRGPRQRISTIMVLASRRQFAVLQRDYDRLARPMLLALYGEAERVMRTLFPDYSEAHDHHCSALTRYRRARATA